MHIRILPVNIFDETIAKYSRYWKWTIKNFRTIVSNQNICYSEHDLSISYRHQVIRHNLHEKYTLKLFCS